MFSANHPYFNICFNIELPMKNGADIECGVGREREGEREREREIGYAWDEQEATYYFKHGTNCHTPY